MPDAEKDAGAERTQRQVYFRISHEEDQKMWQAFREGRATEALNLIITTHVAREHHAGHPERADAWDEGYDARGRDAANEGLTEVTLTPNPYRVLPPGVGA